MASDPDDRLRGVDRALRQMRHVLEPPAAVDDEGRQIETSTLLVLEAILDGAASTVRDVARELDVAHSTASRLVTRAEGAGMVERQPSPADGRETLVRATELGAATRERGLAFRLARLTAVTQGWPSHDLETFAAQLARFADAAAPRAQRRAA